MKMTRVKSAIQKLAFPLLMIGLLWADNVRANVDGDVTSIRSDQENNTYTASGVTIDFRITLAGTFVWNGLPGSSEALRPQLRMVVNGDVAFATLYTLSQYTIAGSIPRTDAIFRYTVKPGDMAQPLKIYGSENPPIDYQWYWNSWQVVNATNTAETAVWKFNDDLDYPGWGEVYDLDLHLANITVRTLSFDDADSESSIPARENNHDWRVTTVNPTESAVVDFYVWTRATNIVQIGNIPNQTWALLSMPTNTTYIEFPIKGLAVGTADIYLQRTKDYLNNSALGITTNYIKRTLTITTPPAPWVQIVMADNGRDNITLSETNALNTGRFYVELSESFSNSVAVKINLTTNQNYVTLNNPPLIVNIPAGQTISSDQYFNVPDGNETSMWGVVTMTPVVTNASAAAYFTDSKFATIRVENVKPSVTASASTPIYRGVASSYGWNAKDVAADSPSLRIEWNFNGVITNVYGESGFLNFAFDTVGTKTVTVRAYDKDNGISDPYIFTVDVVPPVPKPSVSVVADTTLHSETNGLNTGKLSIILSETVDYDVYVKLAATLQGAAQSNLVLFTTNAVRISAGNNSYTNFSFSVPDGTSETAMFGVDIMPTVTSSPADTKFTDLLPTTVFIENRVPVITKPVASDVSLEPQPAYTNVPLGRSFEFQYRVTDVTRDLNSMIVTWQFGDGTPDVVVTGAVGSAYHTYGTKGIKIVTVWATDKDGGISQLIEFPVRVVDPPPPPTVRILDTNPLFETTIPNTGSLMVELTEAFTNLVYVNLETAPVNSPLNGSIELLTTQLLFQVGQTVKTVKYSARDGTPRSERDGFWVVPHVVNTPAAVSYFSTIESNTVSIVNNVPSFDTPTATDSLIIPQGSSYPFDWSITDVPEDCTSWPIATAMTVTWFWGDGSTSTVYGATGRINHTYTSAGEDITVRAVARDKDRGMTTVSFKVSVRPSKEVMVTPIGPNTESDYYGAPRQSTGKPDGTAGGLGDGMVSSRQARGSANRNNTYFFTYDPGVLEAELEAFPYKTHPTLGYYYVTNYTSEGTAVVNPTAILYDSFFFVWVGADQGLPEAKLNPATTTQSTKIALPDSTSDSTGTEIRDVQAIFSREWLDKDNMGDINADGIPDKIANNIWTSIGGTTGGGTTDGESTPTWLQPLNTYNDDLDRPGGTAVGDFLPLNPTGIGGTIDFRPVADPNTGSGGIPVNAFTAFREVRGFERGLNRPGISDPDGNQDEPGTDPTLADTDGDGFPDGWEYWFWYQAKFNNRTGEAYNAADVGQGTFIASKVIEAAYQPAVAGADQDLDNDGLRDVEELTIGTDPTHWDTDRDGICDGWELIRLLNPRNPVDASSNPDGDYMAYATVDRQLATVVDSSNVTNYYLAIGANVTTNIGTFTTVYHYGDSNAVYAVGRPVTLADDATVVDIQDVEAILLHFQVNHQLGFDPRTAWINTMNYREPDYKRFPDWINRAPNTKAFTCLDEYLLMKFVAELRLNGSDGLTVPTQGEWESCSTHPHTPDTDADPVTRLNDGMPDGWELYVAIKPGLDMSVARNRVMVISPWDNLDGALDDTPLDKDKLANRREFAGTESSAAYTNVAFYGVTNGTPNAGGWVTVSRPSADATWINKFWPTDPWNADTDNDGLGDSAERTFVYIPATAPIQDNHTTCQQGGGLNPNAMDTDWDAIPDHWENMFSGTAPATPGVYSGIIISNGMDGTAGDASQDWDRDGLRNYQEYWVQAVRGFRYDITDAGTTNSFGVPGVPMNIGYYPSMLFTQVTNAWDVSKYPWGFPNTGINLWVLLPIGTDPGYKAYASTDPQNFDTDLDGMDDYYELFHGLNPILGDAVHTDNVIEDGADRIASAYRVGGAITISYHHNDWLDDVFDIDFVLYPWLSGLPQVDVDADGMLNLEEMLLANSAAPANPNTDPTPIWMTDSSSPSSLTACYYYTGVMKDPNGIMYYWPPLPVDPPAYLFSFEENEGYDTDNDGISDKAELVDSRNAQSDPQDHDDPVRRQALWFDGVQSAASSAVPYGNFDINNLQLIGDSEWSFRSFTVELWARPEVTNSHQVLIERGFYYGPSDASTPDVYVRRNFRIGIAADGRLYAGFDNAGADTHDPHTSTVVAYGNQVTPNEWVHVAARMDGKNQTFTLFVNGEVRRIVETALTPANGVLIVRDDPNLNLREITSLAGSFVCGAANNLPLPISYQTWSSYDLYYKGYIDEVRIWDGARDNDSIRSDYTKRFTYDDLWANRAVVAAQVARGYSRDSANSLQLSPLLMGHYTFDNLFGADSTNSVSTSPRGFMAADAEINRPLPPYAEVGWWSGSEVRSTVYNNYRYLPWIENGYDHMPIFGGVTTNGTSSFVLLMTNTVSDSVFWTHTTAGTNHQVNTFPNRCTPYGVFYFAGDSSVSAGFSYSRDLLPLGGAFAKQAATMWDNQGPAESWLETGIDSDSDGLADWWELYFYGDLSHGWNDIYSLDGLGLTNGQRYQRDIANGATETNPSGGGLFVQTADTDGDGLPDWWEKMFNLKHDSADGRNGAGGDPDRDGLSNLAEYWITEIYKFAYLSPLLPTTLPAQKTTDYHLKKNLMTFGEMFTDHDFIEDAWEDGFPPYSISRYIYDSNLDNDGDGWCNWAEARAATDVSRNMHLDPAGFSAKDFPVPMLAVKMSYNGVREDGPVVINAYSKPEMDGIPDAVFSLAAPGAAGAGTLYSKNLNFWSARTVKGFLSPGSISPGTVNMTFTDVSPDGKPDGNVHPVIAMFDVYTDFEGLTGVLMGEDSTGWNEVIGTINYVTGEYSIDLSWFEGMTYGVVVSPGVVAVISPESSYMTISYNASQVEGWPKSFFLSDADQGYLVEGTNFFFAFMDLNGSGAWDAGEPCGTPTPFATDINWDLNKIVIQLTDYTPNYLRMTLNPPMRSEDVYFGTGSGDSGDGSSDGTSAGFETRVRVRRTTVDGSSSYQVMALDKTFDQRTFIHEGDFLVNGYLGLDWGLPGVPTSLDRNMVVYDVFVGTATVLTNNALVLSFTNRFDASQAKSTAISPINGAYVYSARPTFRWSMPEGYTAFALEIRKGSSTGPVIYQSGETQAAIRDVITDDCIWEAPIHANDRLPNGQLFAANTVYAWRVIALNSKYTLAGSSTSAWSDWKAFRLDVSSAMGSTSAYGDIKAIVKYFGPITNLSNSVKVQVFNTRGFTGVPVAEYTMNSAELTYLTTPGTTNVNAVLRGLAQSSEAGDYYVRAFIDQNHNNLRDPWESWGYANYYGLTDRPYDVRPYEVVLSAQNPTASIVIEDADTDQDWFPDGWEYQTTSGAGDFLGLVGPSSSWDGSGNTEVNPDLLTSGAWWSMSIFSAYSLGGSDQDADGLSDMAELLLGGNATSASTAGDGYSDSSKVGLGLSPSDLLSLGVTGLGVNPAVANVQWQLSVRRDASIDRTFFNALTGASSSGTVRYDVEFKASLDDTAWTTVETGAVTLEGTQEKLNQIDKQAVENSEKGFFRVRLSPLTE